jgi:hypothetical protein
MFLSLELPPMRNQKERVTVVYLVTHLLLSVLLSEGLSNQESPCARRSPTADEMGELVANIDVTKDFLEGLAIEPNVFNDPAMRGKF